MSGYQAALDYLSRLNGASPQAPDPLAAPTPAQGAQIIDFETPLPEMEGEPDFISLPEDSEEPFVEPYADPASDPAPEPAQSTGDGYTAALAYLQRQSQATQQAVTEATTPDDRLPIANPALADALGVLDYRDPTEGQRRMQAVALGEILGLPEYEKVQLGAAPVNADGTVTIRRATAVSPEAQAAADQQMAAIQAQTATDLRAQDPTLLDQINTARQWDIESWSTATKQNLNSWGDNIGRAARRGWAQGEQALALETGDAATASRAASEIEANRANPEYLTTWDPATSPAESWEAFKKDPIGNVAQLIAESGAALLRTQPSKLAVIPERAMQGAIAGGAAGLAGGPASPVTAPAGFASGAMVGAGAGFAESAALSSYSLELAGNTMDALRKAGVDVRDRDQLQAALADPATMADIRQEADKKAIPVSFVDGLMASIGGRIFSKPGTTALSKAGQWATELATQALGGMTGEAASQLNQQGQITDPKGIIAEGLAETVTSVGEVAVGRTLRPGQPTQPPVNPQVNPPTAPAEVPQNFTPISQPAPAQVSNDTSAPRTLGQVRAPQIAIDPAALDETFGPSTPIPPNTSTAPAAASGAPASTGSPDLITGEGARFSFTTNGITPEQQASTELFAGAINQQLRTQGVLQPDQNLTLQPVALDRVDAGAGFADFLEGFQSITGTTVQFVKPSDPTIFGGAVRSDDARTIFINAESQRPALALIGHEWGHTIQNTDPTLYKELRRVVARYTDDYRSRAREAGASPLYQGTRAKTAELTNNTLGDAFLDPAFWNSLRAEDQPMAKRLWENLTNWFNEILARSKGTAWGTEQFATNLSAMRRDLARVARTALRPPTQALSNAEVTTAPALIDLAIEAHHGTPHKVDKFSTDKIGTGEGAQAYGWGIYFAEALKVAEEYRKNLSKKDTEEKFAKDQRIQAAIQKLNSARKSNDPAAIKSATTELDLISLALEDELTNPGNLYAVKLDVDDADLLDWDKPLSQQSEKVQNALAKLDPETYSPESDDYDANEPGQITYNRIPRGVSGNAKVASEKLLSLGIKGIRYLDAGSRGDGQGTYNYVVFDENLIKIKAENGQPISREVAFAAEPKPRKFSQSLQAAPGVAPEVKSRLTSLDYDPVSNAETLANARTRIDSAGSIDTAFTDLMGKPAIEGWQPSAEDYATGMELMAQLQNRSRHADAASIANMMATRATDQGRAIQALSMIGRLGPQGIELFAQQQLQAAATKPAKSDKQKAAIQAKITEARQFQGEIDKLRRNSTTAAIVANKDLIKSELPPGVDAVQVNIAIREAILGAPTPLAAQAATSSILTGQGLSDKGAARISGSIVRDFLKTTQDTRATALQDLLATADSDRRLDKSKLGSLIRLNREGQLTDPKLHAAMAKMLGIPHWSAEHSAKVQRILAQREKATDPRIKLVKAAEALDVVYRDFMPPGFLDKVDTIQTIAMLLNPKTVGRNVIGNTLMAGADLAADAVSVPMDALVSLGTGQRTRTGLSLGERLMGLGAGVGDIRAGYDFARSEGQSRAASLAEGVNILVRLGRLQSSGKYNSSDISALSGPTFTAPVLRQLESTLGLVLSISDRGFYESAFRASLDTRMKAAAANGTPMLAPDPDMVAAARMDAGRAIYQDDNAASRTLGGLRRVLNFNQRWGIGSLLMKFTQVPGSILTRAVEFSPLGFIRTAYESLAPMLSSSREFDQQAFTDSFSRALVGTTGLVATGYWLAHLGIISAGSDAKDEDKRNLNRATGWGAYKLNTSALKRALMTGNFWTPQKQQRDDMVIGYDWAQPLSIGVAMGAYSRENQEAIKQDILAGKKQSLAANGLNWLAYAGGAATGAMNSLVEQPLLTGLNQFARDVGYDNIPGALLKTAAEAPGTFIPTAARQWMQLTDNSVRETRDSSPTRQFINELKSQLPGLSNTLPQKYDIAGQPIERWAKDSNTLFNVLFNPSMVTYIKSSPALTEMSQVYKYTAETGAVPNQVKPEFTLEGVKARLTSEEISSMQKDMGTLSIAALEKYVLEDPRYDKATWDAKARAMTRALEKAATAAKYRILLARPDLKDRAKQEYDAIQATRAATQADMLAPAGP
jgi:hypothetical protein